MGGKISLHVLIPTTAAAAVVPIHTAIIAQVRNTKTGLKISESEHTATKQMKPCFHQHTSLDNCRVAKASHQQAAILLTPTYVFR